MKLVYACSPSHYLLRDSIFLPSLRRTREKWDLREIQCIQTGEGNFQAPDWTRVESLRMEGMRKIAAEHRGEVMILSDVDIQFFAPLQELAVQSLGRYDIVFQREHLSCNSANLGFVIMRCNPPTLTLLEILCSAIQANRWDQEKLNELIAQNRMPCSFGFLPDVFANDNLIPSDGHPLNGMVLYHSIGTFPQPEFSSVAQKIQRHRMMAARMEPLLRSSEPVAGTRRPPRRFHSKMLGATQENRRD